MRDSERQRERQREREWKDNKRQWERQRVGDAYTEIGLSEWYPCVSVFSAEMGEPTL